MSKKADGETEEATEATETEETETTETEETETEDGGEKSGKDDADAEEEETEDDEDEDDEEEDAEDDDEEKPEAKGGDRAEKRIRSLSAKVKDLSEQLEDAQKAGGADGETYRNAAAAAGVLPSMLTKESADAISKANELKGQIRALKGVLAEADGDEIQLGDKTWSRSKLRVKLETLEDDYEDVKDDARVATKAAQKKAREIFELGLKAKKAGWTGTEKKRENDLKNEHQRPSGAHAPVKTLKKGKADWSKIDSEDALEKALESEEPERE